VLTLIKLVATNAIFTVTVAPVLLAVQQARDAAYRIQSTNIFKQLTRLSTSWLRDG